MHVKTCVHVNWAFIKKRGGSKVGQNELLYVNSHIKVVCALVVSFLFLVLTNLFHVKVCWLPLHLLLIFCCSKLGWCLQFRSTWWIIKGTSAQTDWLLCVSRKEICYLKLGNKYSQPCMSKIVHLKDKWSYIGVCLESLSSFGSTSFRIQRYYSICQLCELLLSCLIFFFFTISKIIII